MSQEHESMGHIHISPDAKPLTVTIRPWTAEEIRYWYRTGRILSPLTVRLEDEALFGRHPELTDMDGSLDNLYGGGFED